MQVSLKHIEWIDGAKGIAIISVILLHSIPCLLEIGSIFHIGQAVPVFLFITAYLISIHFDGIRSYFNLEKRITKTLKKIFVPFIIVLFFQIICLTIVDNCPSLKTILKLGGIGPGSYYIWLYIQLWIITPFVCYFLRKSSIILSFLSILFVSIISEYIFVLLEDVSYIDELYRLLPIRYIMVIYLGSIWSSIAEKWRIFFKILALFSALFILCDIYVFDNESVVNIIGGGKIVPLIWSGYHWYTAFYVLIPITLLQKIKYSSIVKQAGKASWYIFLLQMMCFGF